MKTVPTEMIKKRVLRTGDGTHKYSKLASEDAEQNCNNNNVNERDTEHFWGWGKHRRCVHAPAVNNDRLSLTSTGDKEMTAEDMKNVEILHKEFD